MKRFVKQFMILFALCWVMTAHAADGDVFTATSTEGIEMTFKVISESEKTCQVGDGRMYCLADESVAPRGGSTSPCVPPATAVRFSSTCGKTNLLSNNFPKCLFVSGFFLYLCTK